MNEEQLKKDKLLLEHWKEQCDIAAKIDGEAHLSQFGINQLLEAQKRLTEAEVRRELTDQVIQLKEDLKVSAGLDKVVQLLSPNPEQDD